MVSPGRTAFGNRDLVSMHQSPRCGARTRKGTPCRSPAVRGKRRCRMHGGAKGSGAPMGNQNAYKTGDYTRERLAERRKLRGLIREWRDTIRDIEEDP
jgi:hypothetical protein